MLWTLALLVRERPREAALAGALCALSLAIGQEMAPAIVAVAALVALRWIMRGEASREFTAAFGMAFAAGRARSVRRNGAAGALCRHNLRCAIDRADADRGLRRLWPRDADRLARA